MDGARHQRLLTKVQLAWQQKAEPLASIPPATAFAIKGALFNVSLPATQLTYFHYEWRASAGGLLRTELWRHVLRHRLPDVMHLARIA